MASQAVFSIPLDPYRCVTVKTKKVSFDSAEDFEKKLLSSVGQWQDQHVRCVNVKVAISHSELVPVCVKNGFVFHHAQHNYVQLKRWLSATDPDNMPAYANQYLGCAGFVVSEHNELLVVKERFAAKSHWKLPGGLANPGEEIAEAAIREVQEETGVRTQFLAVICFRHQHNFRFGCSDLYFICLLKPLSRDIKTCRNEIAQAMWMDLEEYVRHPEVTEANRHFAQCYLEQAARGRAAIQPHRVPAYRKDILTSVYTLTDVTAGLGQLLTSPGPSVPSPGDRHGPGASGQGAVEPVPDPDSGASPKS